MSVLIKGMEMPQSCYDCPCRMIGYTKDHCNVLGKFIDCVVGSEDRREDCPLIEIPPHGRLIDADELMTKMIEYGWHHPDSTVHEFVEDELHTVIPADKDGET